MLGSSRSWSYANPTDAKLYFADLPSANLRGATCDNDTVWPDSIKGYGGERPFSD